MKHIEPPQKINLRHFFASPSRYHAVPRRLGPEKSLFAWIFPFANRHEKSVSIESVLKYFIARRASYDSREKRRHECNSIMLKMRIREQS